MNPRSPSETDVPTLRSRLRQATDAAILEAAEQVFADQGLHGARMNDIGARAGVAVGTLYNHFKDRDALLAGLLELRAGEILEAMDRAIAEEAKADFRERLTATLRNMFTYFAAHRQFFTIFQQSESADFHVMYPVAGKQVPELLRQVYARIDKLVKHGVRSKALRPESAELYPALIMCLLRVNKIRDRMSAGSAPCDAAELVRIFLDGAGT